VTNYDLSKFAKRTRRAAPHNVWGILETPGFFAALPSVPGALEGIGRLLTRHRVALVTARPPGAEAETRAWVTRRLGSHRQLTLDFARQKHLLPADVIFDDTAHVLADYRSAWPLARAATIAYPYNTAAQRWAYVAGSYERPTEAWINFVDWLEVS
jgi:5'(3')-deoxyribonucleotidase